MIPESPINRESRRRELESNGESSLRGVPEQKEMLTLTVATKTSFHEQPVNFNFTHSLNSGVGDGEWRVVSPLPPGVERHRCAKSGENSNAWRRDR